MLSKNPPKVNAKKKPKPLLEQIGDELDQTGLTIYSFEEASNTRNQEHLLLTNQINYTNQQIHFFKQCYLPQILESLYNGKITNQEQGKIHETLCGYLVSVEHSLAEIEHPKDESEEMQLNGGVLIDGGVQIDGRMQINDKNCQILSLEDAKTAFVQSKKEFQELKHKFQNEKRKNNDLKKQQTVAVQNYLNNISKIDDCVVQLKDLFDKTS